MVNKFEIETLKTPYSTENLTLVMWKQVLVKTYLKLKTNIPQQRCLNICHWQIFSEKWSVKKLKNSQETISRI